jgi:hypothetical protein
MYIGWMVCEKRQFRRVPRTSWCKRGGYVEVSKEEVLMVDTSSENRSGVGTKSRVDPQKYLDRCSNLT